ncbi:hypothetical protein ACLOJK_026637 [Asimina triloba]
MRENDENPPVSHSFSTVYTSNCQFCNSAASPASVGLVSPRLAESFFSAWAQPLPWFDIAPGPKILLMPSCLLGSEVGFLSNSFSYLNIRLDKTRFHINGAILFTAQSAVLHPTTVVKTRMQVAGADLAHMNGLSVFKSILRNDGIAGIFRGFGTGAIGAMPGRVLALTSLEVSKEMMMKSTEGLDMPEATRIGVVNGVAGMISNLVSCVYFVPLDVRLMVQGLPGMTTCSGPFDVINKVLRTEGFRGLFRGFGLTAVTQSPASALWWGAYGSAQHVIWRSLGYGNDAEKRPSHLDMVTVQATAGTIAGACSSLITTPIDTIKTRLQVMDNYGSGRPSVIKTTKLLLQEDGWMGFYRGFGPRFLNMSLWGTSMIVTYELIIRMVHSKAMIACRPSVLVTETLLDGAYCE